MTASPRARRALPLTAQALCLSVTLLLALVAPAALVAQTIPNPSFETNAVFTNFPGYSDGNAAISGWTSNNPARTGLNPGTNFSPFADNSTPPNGACVAFVQSIGNSTTTLSTTITGLTVGTWYRVQFRANARIGTALTGATYRLNGGAAVAFSAPAGSFNTIHAIFQATATTAPLELSNTTAADSSLLVDHFTIASVAPIVVTNNSDAAAGSLRAALTTAATGANAAIPNVITFAAGLNGGTITLASELVVDGADEVVIDASSLAGGLTIDGGPNPNRIFTVGGFVIGITTRLTIRNLTLTGGNTTGQGGAISCGPLATLTMSRCTLSGNTAASGGAISNGSQDMTLERCTLSNNNATTGDGGAIGNGGVLVLRHCTLSGNTSGATGGGIYNTVSGQGKAMVENCIIAGNLDAAAGGEDITNGGSSVVTLVGANIIRQYSGAAPGGPAAITDNPQLSPLANNGGPTQTMAIAAASPARNAAVGSTITADQRGSPTIGVADIGAFEMSGASTFNLSSATYSGFEGGVAEVVIHRNGGVSGVSTVRLFTTTPATATSGSDFAARANTTVSDVSFLDGEISKTIAIPLTADNLAESNETFTITIGSPSPTGATVGAPVSSTVTIQNAYQVNNTNNAGGGSLRQALSDAAANPGPDGIGFAPALAGQTITLASELVVTDSAAITIDASSVGGVTISGNNATRIFLVHAGSNLTLRRLTLTKGSTDWGAAMLNLSGAVTALHQCTLTENVASIGGGAVYYSGFAGDNGSLSLTQCTVSSNSAGRGGGILSSTIEDDTDHGTHIDRCTISGNQATEFGGGIFSEHGVTTILHCTITGNSAPPEMGSGIASQRIMTETIVEKSIVSGNTGSSVDIIFGTGNTYTSNGGNIIGSGNAIAFFNQPGDVINDDPGLTPLANNGGPTRTHALLANSPARDRATGSAITSDQRGFMINGAADSGAYEVQQGGIFAFSSTTFRAIEGQPASVVISRTGSFTGPATVRLTTTNISAVGGTDYTAMVNTTASDVTFLDGQSSKSVAINTNADFLAESNETFTASLSLPTPASPSSVGTPATATVTIVEPLLVTNTNDDGPGSLRQAFVTAATNPGTNIITFATALNGQTITLGSEIVVDDAAAVTVDASNLAAGITLDGGPGANRILCVGNSIATTLTLRCLTFTGGNGVGLVDGNGGAIRHSSGNLTLERCTLNGNSAGGDGCTGGAIYNQDTVTLKQCTLSGNSAAGTGVAGGALLNAGTMTVTQCTITNNSTDGSGGGIFNFATLNVRDCIVAGNSGPATSGSQDICNPIATANFIGTSLVPSFEGSGTVGNPGGQNSTDPKLVSTLAANGGPTKTHALQADSPAIDAGSDSPFTTDQRGLPIVSTPDIGAFEVQLGGVFVLEKTGYATEESQGATIKILRTGGTQGTASVRLFTTPGSASTSDFTTRPNTAASEIAFNDGESFKEVDVFTQIDAIVEANESFNVSLGSPSAGTSLSTPSTATVSIEDPSSGPGQGDVAKPSVVITSPAASATVNVDVGGQIIVTGTAMDNKGVRHVSVSLNGVGQGTAVLEKPSATSTKFSMVLGPSHLNPGINSVRIKAADAANNETTPEVTRTFKVRRPLLVNISGHGSVTTGFAPRSYREVNAPQTITATAGTGYLFAGWSIFSSHTPTQIGTSTVALEKNTLTFVHRENLVLRAIFVPNPYALASSVGTFNGTIKPNSSTSNLTTEGYASILVQNTGAFSGSIKIDGLTLGVAGTFDHTGAARFGTSRARTLSVARPEKPSLSVALTINTGTGKITGSVAHFDASTLSVTAHSDVDADRASFSATSPVPDLGYLVPNAHYNVHFIPDEPGNQPAGYGQAEFPNGYGHGTAKVTSAGAVTVTGLLPDGTPITMTTTLSQDYKFRLFAQLYTGMQGVVAANIEFNDNFTDIDLSAFDSLWIRPVQDVQHYAGGWPAGLSLDVGGTKLIFPSGQSIMRPLPASDLDGNAKLTFSDGISSPIVKTVGISDTDVVSKLPAPPDPSFTLRIDRATGTFSGTIMLNGTSVLYKGVIKNKTVGIGYGYCLTPTPAVKDYTGRSLRVTLEPQP